MELKLVKLRYALIDASSNCTFMELKFNNVLQHLRFTSSNCTFMELKYEKMIDDKLKEVEF